LVKYGQLLD
jgi:FKBP-type peptidyl-prolyl cis-trans isomerase